MNKERIESKGMEEGNLDNLNTQLQTSTINKEADMHPAKEMDNDKEAAEMNVQMIDVKAIEIKYHPRKYLGDIERLQNSIRRDGLQEPLLVYEAGENRYAVIDGCRRLKAIQEFGWLTVPCIIKKDVGVPEAAHLSYVKNTQRKAFDPIETALHLKAMMQEFDYSLRDLELKGYGTPASISDKLKLLDLYAPVQKQVQEGELTAAHGRHLVRLPSKTEQERMAKRIIDHNLTAKKAEQQIDKYLAKGEKKDDRAKVHVPSTDIPGVYMKDSTNMSELPDKSVHMIMSSPPYNVGMEFEKGVTFDEHLEMVRDVLKECARVLVPGGIMALNVADITNFKGRKGKNDHVQIELMGHKYQSYLRKYQIFLTDLIMWQKLTPWRKRLHISYTEKTAHTSYRISNDVEPVYIFRKKGQREVPSEDVVLRSRLTKEQWIAWIPGAWQINAVRNQQEHPCVYPDELCHRLIKMFSYEGDTVLDPWLGSGTTVKVARELNREGIGYEKEAQYKAVIMKKLGIAPEKAEAQFFTNMMGENIQKIEAAEIENIQSTTDSVQDDTEAGEATVECADDYLDKAENA